MRALSLDELATQAQAVVQAQAVDRLSYWENGRILTRITLHIEEVWRNNSQEPLPSELDLVTLGGVVGEIGQVAHGAVSFEPGERAIIFLTRRAQTYRALGMAQGLFYIHPGAFIEASPTLKRRLEEIRLEGPHAVGPFPNTLKTLRRAVQRASHAH